MGGNNDDNPYGDDQAVQADDNNGDYVSGYYSTYDYSHYYDIVEFKVTSVQPSAILIGHTAGYTAICVFIGFIFKCRKKKWKKKKGENVESKNQEEVVQNSLACGDPSMYMCAVDEVIDNAFFDHAQENNSDAGSVVSDTSSKAYEDWFGPDVNEDRTVAADRYTAATDRYTAENDRYGVATEIDVSHETSANSSYELYFENEINNKTSKHVKEIDESSPRSSFANGATGSERARECPYLGMVSSETFQDETRRTNEGTTVEASTSPKKQRIKSLARPTGLKKKSVSTSGQKKKKKGLKGILFPRRKSIDNVYDCDETQTRYISFSRVFHSSTNCEIELKEGEFPVDVVAGVGGHDESYEQFNHRADPNEVDKFTDPKLNCSTDKSNSSKNDVTDTSGEGDDTFENEMREINKLVCAWTVSSFITDFASIISIALIASYMSIAEMICFSYVWFIIDAAFLLSTALYNSMYKHVSNAIAPDTEEGYFKAGKYIRISIIINLILSIPIAIGVVLGMGSIFRMYGFDDSMIQLCSSYTVIAVIHSLTTSTSDFITSTTEIEGYADFNAKYSFFDSLTDIAVSFFVIPLMKPSLVQLGIIHYAHDIISTAFYYYLTWYRYGIYEPYVEGIKSPLTYDRKDKKAFATLIKKAIPMSFDELNEQLEWLVSAYLASFLGNAESTSWILLSYIWSLIDIVPSNIGSAAEVRVSNQLSKGNIVLAQAVANGCMLLTGATSVIGTGLVFVLRYPLIKAMASDANLTNMLIKVMPYLLLCQPLISLTSTAAYLNRALAMYQRSTKVELLVTCLITIPAGLVSTFYFRWDISGLTAASFIGSATVGAVVLALYNNADWDKAVRKNRKIAGIVDSSKLDTSIDTQSTDDTQESAQEIDVMSIEHSGVLV